MTTRVLTVIFDGDCGICQALRQRAETHDRAGRLRFVAYQTADLDTIAPGLTSAQASRALYTVAPDGTRHDGARAFFETMQRLPAPWSMIGRVGSFPWISRLAEPVYRLVARHRGTISRRLGLDQCRIELPDRTP